MKKLTPKQQNTWRTYWPEGPFNGINPEDLPDEIGVSGLEYKRLSQEQKQFIDDNYKYDRVLNTDFSVYVKKSTT